ncbi:MAG: ribose-5-phosphate isomerase RpiA [Alphaproteobacteria bacterium]|nr:ribose-5-phosphate isomerase RpiA [Alphaproteobacteria bacterium]MBL6937127.1 ribose-5-phosphate isomerase RpiA [Alphaproteobacteria bacterium]MBL7096311.1 ribose-5-phosphate isomerase RpiA [Alphaproteobacteria bacterium]
MPTEQDRLKRAAAARALDYVTDGMKLGLGTGSTAEAFIDLLGPRVRGGLKLLCVPTSERTTTYARKLGLSLGNLDDLAPLDLTVDGADEADRELTLIKGAGGALLREKIVARASKRMVVIADESKLVARLGKFTLPVEVLEFGHKTTARHLSEAFTSLGYSNIPITLRQREGAIFKSDSGNVIYDCAMGAITSAAKLAAAISAIPGAVEHGLFIGIATTLLIAHPGEVEVIAGEPAAGQARA